MKGELLQDLNNLIQYLGIMRDTDDIAELERYNSMSKAKLKEIYKGKKALLKKERKDGKKSSGKKTDKK